MSDRPIYISVGRKYAYVPEAKSIMVNNGIGTIIGGKYDGAKVIGATGASAYASFFAKNKDYEEVDFRELLEDRK